MSLLGRSRVGEALKAIKKTRMKVRVFCLIAERSRQKLHQG